MVEVKVPLIPSHAMVEAGLLARHGKSILDDLKTNRPSRYEARYKDMVQCLTAAIAAGVTPVELPDSVKAHAEREAEAEARYRAWVNSARFHPARYLPEPFERTYVIDDATADRILAIGEPLRTRSITVPPMPPGAKPPMKSKE